jgi:hypothetical protein
MGKYSVRKQCAHEGCQHCTHYEFDTRKEEREFRKKDTPWLCLRHTDPGGILSMERDQLVRARELVSYETQHTEGGKAHQYWITPEQLEEKGEKGGSGTKIEVETRVTVILPEPEY